MATSMTGSGNVIDSSTTWLVRVAEGVTGGGVLQADHRVDVPAGGPLDRVLLVGVHLEQLARCRSFLPLVALMTWAPDSTRARVHPDVGQLAEERVRGDLERQRRERLVGRRLADDRPSRLARQRARRRRGTSSGDGR